MSVFDTFPEFLTPYKYLVLTSTANGYKIDEEHASEGIPKIIEGMTEADNLEASTSDARLKIKLESFLPENINDVVGNGIELLGLHYRIEGVSLAQDGDFYNLNLKREAIWDESPLPLE